jgi:hypothetical protein
MAVGTEILRVTRSAVNIQRTDAAQPLMLAGKVSYEMS